MSPCTNGIANLHKTLKAIANNPGYSNFEDYVDEADPSDEMDGFEGRGASVYDQEYNDEELVDLAETDSSGEDMATEAEAETIRPSRHARETQNVFMAASSGMFHNPLRHPPTVGPSADDDDNEGFSCIAAKFIQIGVSGSINTRIRVQRKNNNFCNFFLL